MQNPALNPLATSAATATTRSPLETLLRGVLTSVLALGATHCAASVGNSDGAVSDAVADTPISRDGPIGPDVTCTGYSERVEVTIDESFCFRTSEDRVPVPVDAGTGEPPSDAGGGVIAPDAGAHADVQPPPPLPDAGVDPATCQLDCTRLCQGRLSSYLPGAAPYCNRLTATTAECVLMRPCGRSTDGACSSPESHEANLRTLAGWLRTSAHLEAIAVDAFERMTLELAHAGAPEALVSLARSAADEERRHTHVMTTLAARMGVAVETPPVEPRRVRPVREFALENAVEGCVRETFGALLALHQAEHAHDETVRRAMRVIAPDECRHATLSWQLAAWAEPLLDAADRATVRAARDRAWSELFTALATGSANTDDADAMLGLPRADTALALAVSLRSALEGTLESSESHSLEFETRARGTGRPRTA